MDRNRLRIMVVDDDAMIAFLLGEILKGLGHDVCATEGAEDGAISAALACKPDLMIVDEHLGEGSGMKVVDVVCEQEWVPHIFVSGDFRAVERLRPRAVIVAKPYSEAGLANAIQRAMGQASKASPRAPRSSTMMARSNVQSA